MRLLHVLRIVGLFWRTSVAGELEYRSNFFVAALASLFGLAGSAFSLWLFYRGGAGFPGWSLDEGILVLGLFTAFRGVVEMVLAPNLSRIVTHVEAGTLDFVLLKPLDSQLQVSVRVLSPWAAPDIVYGAILVVVSAVRAGVDPLRIPLFVLPLVCGAIILYGLWFLVASTSIWFVKIYNATEVLRGLLDAGRFPMAAYPAAFRVVFTFVVPVAFLTTVPAEALLGRATPATLGGSIAGAVVLLAASRAFWRFALRSYTGASG